MEFSTIGTINFKMGFSSYCSCLSYISKNVIGLLQKLNVTQTFEWRKPESDFRRHIGIISPKLFIFYFFNKLIVIFYNDLLLRVIFVTFQTYFTKILNLQYKIVSKPDHGFLHINCCIVFNFRRMSIKFSKITNR